MEPRVIKTREDHEMFLGEVERLVAHDPDAMTPEADRLELLATLVELYEKEHIPFEKPNAIDAIRFRMEEQGLRQKDLVPYIGSKGRVSEVLSGKRPLSLPMIQAVHEGLGISLEVLMQRPKSTPLNGLEIEWERFPVREMVKMGWITATADCLRKRPAELVQEFFDQVERGIPAQVFCRRTIYKSSKVGMDDYALLAWIARVIMVSKNLEHLQEYKPGTLTKESMQDICCLSELARGPLLAQEYLAGKGVALVIVSHLPRTHLDGGAMLTGEGRPVIGLTLRYDRIDNFWFTLLHELAHVILHLKDSEESFVDDLDSVQENDRREKEATRLALETCIPRSMWRRSDAFRMRTPSKIVELAHELRIHPAIVAGRLRMDTENHRMFNQLVGHNQVRIHFPDLQLS